LAGRGPSYIFGVLGILLTVCDAVHELDQPEPAKPTARSAVARAHATGTRRVVGGRQH